MQLLFSHGAMQLPHIQKDFFDRFLNKTKDTIHGYKLGMFKIINPEIIAVLENDFHSIAMPSENPEDKINGFVFELTEEELKKLDAYSSNCHKCIRIKITSTNNLDCWLYISADKTSII